MVYGKVIDNETGEALIGATIYAINAFGDQRGVTTTDYDGYFQTDQIAHNEKVGISFIGYLTQSFDHRDGIYALTESTQFIPGITVLGKKNTSSNWKKEYTLIIMVILLLVLGMVVRKIYQSNS